MGLSMVFGCLLAAAEGWSMYIGVAYVLSNVLGLQEPLTNDSPEGNLGMVLDIIVSLLAMLSTATVMGIASSMCLIQSASDLLPYSLCGFVRILIFYLPIAILIISCLMGAAFSAIEDWTFWDGFYFVTGGIAELANPIVNVGPSTAEGCFFEIFCVCTELCLCGAAIGTLSAHPQIKRFMRWFEGDATSELEQLKERAAEIELQLSKCKDSKWGRSVKAPAETPTQPGSTDEHDGHDINTDFI